MKRFDPVDVVALVLAVSLGATVLMILVATTVQIVDHQTPDLTLSENATQILIAGIGGFTGLLGAYIGGRRRRGPAEPEGQAPSAGPLPQEVPDGPPS